MAKITKNKTLMNAITKIAYAQGLNQFSAVQMKEWLHSTGKKKISLSIGRTETVSWALKFHPNIQVHDMGNTKSNLYSYKDNTESKAKAGE
jgi:hypothetical protein